VGLICLFVFFVFCFELKNPIAANLEDYVHSAYDVEYYEEMRDFYLKKIEELEQKQKLEVSSTGDVKKN
jgi:hypothetical protein